MSKPPPQSPCEEMKVRSAWLTWDIDTVPRQQRDTRWISGHYYIIPSTSMSSRLGHAPLLTWKQVAKGGKKERIEKQ